MNLENNQRKPMTLFLDNDGANDETVKPSDVEENMISVVGNTISDPSATCRNIAIITAMTTGASPIDCEFICQRI